MKKTIRYVIGVDPSGNHHLQKNEGDGTTGIAVYDREEDKIVHVAEIESSAFKEWQAFFKATWIALTELLKMYPGVISIEDYILYPSKSSQQSWSHVPTARLLGYILMECWLDGIDYYIRPAVDVKLRWTNDILLERGYIVGTDNEKSVGHCHGKTKLYVPGIDEPLKSHHLDAIRHAIHCGRLEIPKERGHLND